MTQQSNRYYFSAVYEIVPDSEEEAGRLFDSVCLVFPEDGPIRLLEPASGMDGMEPGDGAEDDSDCICPPGLVARGGFRGGCPVHHTDAVTGNEKL